MNVIKRDQTIQGVDFNKITERIQNIVKNQSLSIDPIIIAQKVCTSLSDNIKTTELDQLTAEIAVSLTTEHPDYNILASHISVSDIHKNLKGRSFFDVIESLPNIDPNLKEYTKNHKIKIQAAIDYNKDYLFDYFAIKTLERSYLYKDTQNQTAERPQDLFMRVALGIHSDLTNDNSITDVLETYKYMSDKKFIHATPSLFNAGTTPPQLASCFLQDIGDDTISSIYKTLGDSAQISKYAGGIGLHIHNIRATGAEINKLPNMCKGILPMLKVFNDTAKYVCQCFTGDTMVFTQNGSKRIDNITTNDKVITIDGSFKKVNQIFSNNVGKNILEVKTKLSIEPIKLTKEHNIYVIKRPYKTLNFSKIKERLHNNRLKPEFIKASELQESYLVGYPIQSFNSDNDEYTPDFYRIIGILIGDGYIHLRSRNRAEVKFYLNNTTKQHVVDFVKQYLDNHNVHYWTNVNNKCVSIGCSMSNLSGLKYNTIYNNEKEKYIHPSLFNLTQANTLKLLQGLLETDGCYYKELVFSTTSYQLTHDLKQLLLKFGIVCSGYSSNNIGESHEIRPGEFITNRKISYNIRIPRLELFRSIINNTAYKSVKKFPSFVHNNIIWSGINSITEIPYNGAVYDLNIEDNHNYTLSSFGLVHNSGKRPGSIAIYLQVDHADIFQFLDLKKNTGDEDDRARDLFYAAWIPDLFMQRVKQDGMWSLFCPHSAPGLADVYGEEYKALYEQYEKENRFTKQVKAQELWFAICTAQIETGTPYMLYKDAINTKSNQMNLGTIKSSNLCTEIVQFTSKDETAVCNLASICLPQFIISSESGEPTFDFLELRKVAGTLTNNLNKVIDRNFYPIPEAATSNFKHRPIGIGVQGLADVYILLRMNFDSNEAKELNKKIFETIYLGAMIKSLELAKRDGPYTSFQGSPISKGMFQFDLGDSPLRQEELYWPHWQLLRKQIQEHGDRNSLLIAPMPTASTSQIMGNNECIEPYTSNIYLRRTMAGEFVVVNRHLIKDLMNLNLWTPKMKDTIIQHNGSVQNIQSIPDNLKALYKTAWEISQKVLIEQSADRQKFICQSQSLNLFVGKPTIQKLTSMHFYGWSKGLKTGMYYLRTQPAANPIQFTIAPEVCESCSG